MAEVTIVAGSCAAESEDQVMGMGYKISKVVPIVRPYRIGMGKRSGAWKPRTKCYVDNGAGEELVFEGTGLRGLIWLDKAGRQFNLPIYTELMSEQDLKYFDGTYTNDDLIKADFGGMNDDYSDLIESGYHFDGLDPDKDFIQIGAKSGLAPALSYRVGLREFGVLLKSPLNGVASDQVIGMMQRLKENRQVIYCTRGQFKTVDPSGKITDDILTYRASVEARPNQHPNSRNFNNIECIDVLTEIPELEHVKFFHDPSHTWGGNTHQMRRNIGEYAIKAITEYGYDGIMVEVDDRSRIAKCDGAQALLTTTNGIDWSQTYVREKPPEDQMPYTLVDIVGEIMRHQVETDPVARERIDYLEQDLMKLHEIRWDAGF